MPTDLNEYQNIGDLPDQWRYAINEKGQVYYYHTKILISQWEKPVKFLPLMEEQRINEIDIKVEPHGKHAHSASQTNEWDKLTGHDWFSGRRAGDRNGR